MIKKSLILFFLLSFLPTLPSSASTFPPVEKFIGIAEIPSLFGLENENHETITKPNSSAVKIYSEPKNDAKILATIADYQLLNNIEYGYEKYGALVFEEKNGWYLVELEKSKIKGWIPSWVAKKYYSLYELIETASSIDSWKDKKLSPSPDFNTTNKTANIKGEAPYVEVINKRIVKNNLWIKVKIKDNACNIDGNQSSTTTDQGWMPVFDDSGRLNVWIATRGC